MIGGGLCGHRERQPEHRRDKHTGTVSRKSDDLTKVLIVVADLQVSAKVLNSNLTAR